MGFTQRDLIDAIQTHKLETVRNILQLGTQIDINAYYTGWTALHHAAEEGVMDILELLLQMKNIDRTALHIAVVKNRKEVVKRLLKVPTINPKIRDHTEKTAAELAKENKFLDLFLLIDQFEEQRCVQFEQMEKEVISLRKDREELKRLQELNKSMEVRIKLLEEREENSFYSMTEHIDTAMHKLLTIQKQILTSGMKKEWIEQRNHCRHEVIKSIYKLEQLPFLKYVTFRRELEQDQQQEQVMQQFVQEMNELTENLKEIHLDLEINQLSMSQKKNASRLQELTQQQKKLEEEIRKLEIQVEPKREILEKYQLRQSNAFGFAECSFILSLMKS